jgi:hypothetical protein
MNESHVIIKALKSDGWAGLFRYPKCQDVVGAGFSNGSYHVPIPEEEKRELEKTLQLKEGTLDIHSPYWKDYKFHIQDKDVVLNLQNPDHKIFYYVCLGSKDFANSLNEMDKFPKAKYVLYDAEQDAKKENLKVINKKKAYKHYTSMTGKEMRDVLRLMGKQAENISDTLADNKVSEIVEKEPEEFLRIVSLPDFKARVFLKNLIQNNIVRTNQGHHFFGDIAMGHDEDTTLAFLKDAKNQETVMSLKNKMESLKG